MAHPMGEARKTTLRVNFDLRLKLEFHGSDISSDGSLLPYRELDDALGLPKGEVCQGDGKVGGFWGSRSECMAFMVGMVGNGLHCGLPVVCSVRSSLETESNRKYRLA